MQTLFAQQEIEKALDVLAQQIVSGIAVDERLFGSINRSVLLVGIRTCGVHLAARLQTILQAKFGLQTQKGVLDITLYRDDLHSASHAIPQLRSTQLPSSLEGKYIVLVDDVFYTGRTTRAALQAMLDFGRPICIRLAVLIDRKCHELPIQPDFKAFEVEPIQQRRIELQMREEGFLEDKIVCLSSVSCIDPIVK